MSRYTISNGRYIQVLRQSLHGIWFYPRCDSSQESEFTVQSVLPSIFVVRNSIRNRSQVIVKIKTTHFYSNLVLFLRCINFIVRVLQSTESWFNYNAILVPGTVEVFFSSLIIITSSQIASMCLTFEIRSLISFHECEFLSRGLLCTHR